MNIYYNGLNSNITGTYDFASGAGQLNQVGEAPEPGSLLVLGGLSLLMLRRRIGRTV